MLSYVGRLMRPLPLHSLVLAVVTMGGAVLLACTSSSGGGGDEPTSTPALPSPQSSNGDVVAPKTASGCEELGALSATSLTALLDSSGPSQTTSFAMPNRPSATKVKVIAVGDAADLVGKPAVLGASVNVSYATCTHCLVVAIGCTAAGCADAAFFYPRTGTGTFTSLAEQGGQSFAGTFTDVELEQVNIDPQTFASTPVVHGACMHLSSLTFGSTLSAVPPGGGGNDGGTSSSGSTGEGGGLVDGGSGKSSTSSGGATLEGPKGF